MVGNVFEFAVIAGALLLLSIDGPAFAFGGDAVAECPQVEALLMGLFVGAQSSAGSGLRVPPRSRNDHMLALGWPRLGPQRAGAASATRMVGDEIVRQTVQRRSNRRPILSNLTAVAAIVAAAIVIAGSTILAAQAAPWTASGYDGTAGTFGISSDGVRLDVGCNFRLASGARATVHNYKGNVLLRLDGQTEPIILEVVHRDGSRRSFRAGTYHYAPDDGIS
jgi:hypothetical protein